MVDWTYLATWDYFKASKGNVFYMAQIIHSFLMDLMEVAVPEPQRQFFLSNTLLIGHSLGAHIAGRVGALFNGRIGMIAGLDPAGPLFAPYKRDRHCLSRRDALKVYNLHTATYGNGNRYLLGSKDFYVNGGGRQPELKDSALSLSHKRVTNIFRATIYRPSMAVGYYCGISSHPCDPKASKTYMFDIDDDDTDILDAPIFLPTTGTQPFFDPNLRTSYIPMYKCENMNGYKRITYKN